VGEGAGVAHGAAPILPEALAVPGLVAGGVLVDAGLGPVVVGRGLVALLGAVGAQLGLAVGVGALLLVGTDAKLWKEKLKVF
jgi:hypothetical protein